MISRSSIVILINPKGIQRKTDEILGAITSILYLKKIEFFCFREEWPLEINIYKQIWLIGGDGTLNYLLNHYKEITIPIAVFKGGTGNDFAWKLYGNISIRSQIERLLLVSPRWVDAGKCNGEIFINGLGIGFDGEVLKSMKTIRRMGGHLGYMWIVIKKIFSFRECRFRIIFGHKLIENKFLLVIITNSSRTGGGFMISPRALIDDGKLNLMLCNALPILKRLKYLPVMKKGEHLQLPFINHFETREITIIAEKNLPVQIDGELISGSHFMISVLPKKYLFVY